MSIALNISEILFAGIDMSESKRKKMVNEGSIRKITSKIYTPNMEDSLEDIVKRNVFRILGFLFPHAVISHRSAFELKPTEAGDIYLTYEYTKTRPNTDGFRKNNVNYWVFREIGNIILHL